MKHVEKKSFNVNYLMKLYKYFVYILVFLLSITTHFSQSAQDINQIKKLRDDLNQPQTQIQSTLDGQKIDYGLPQRANFGPVQSQVVRIDTSEDAKDYYFGYDFFTKRDSVYFWENLPTPPDYLLGPGDELIISLWGETQLRKNYTISREGTIYDDQVGLLNLIGKDISTAERYLVNQFGRVYSTLNGPNRTTYIDLSLGKLKSINVNFVGQVNYPGVYPIHPFSTLITGLIQAGGVDTTGSLRKIMINRNGSLYATIDLYDYLLRGKLPKNIQLRDQDVVIVPFRLSTIKMDSSVYRPGIYESILNENVKQIIDYAGGMNSNSSSIIGLERIIPIEDRPNDDEFSKNIYFDYSKSQSFNVIDGDIITVRSLYKSKIIVEIIGQVKNPGVYNFFEGMKLGDLIELGGGFKDTTFMKSVYKAHGKLVRRDPDSRYEKVIEIRLDDIINKNAGSNIYLQNLDRFVIHANPNFFKRDNVTISGEINIPGSYPLIKDQETLKSVLDRAGGLTAKSLKNGITIYREKKFFDDIKPIKQKKYNQSVEDAEKIDDLNPKKVRVAWENNSIILMPGDSIIIKETTGTVKVIGEVYNPGFIEYKKGKSLKYYLNSAGGSTDFGNKNNVIVIHANGVVSPKKWYSSPKIDDGDTIIVNEKEISEPFNPTEFAGTLASFLSSLVTIIVLTQQLGSS